MSSTPVVPTIAVDGVTLSRSSVAVSGCASLPVTVRMHVKRASGTYDETTTPAAVLSRVGAAPAHPEWPRERLVHLKLASGTATDGIYEGVTQVHSTMNGAFKVSQVTTLSREGAKQLPEAAVSGPVLTVKGVHAPALVGVTTNTSPPTLATRNPVITGRVIDTSTGRGYASRVPVYVGHDDACVSDSLAVGAYAAPWTGTFQAKAGVLAVNCVYLRPDTLSAVPMWEDALDRVVWSPRVRSSVSARPAASKVRAGRIVAVTGTTGARGPGCRRHHPVAAPVHPVRVARRQHGEGRQGRSLPSPRAAAPQGCLHLPSREARPGPLGYRHHKAIPHHWQLIESHPMARSEGHRGAGRVV